MSYTELENSYNKIQKFYLGDESNLHDDIDDNDSDTSVASSTTCNKQVIVGVCAMAKKSQSKPMKEILTRLQEFEFIKIVIFNEEVILKEPVESWPICDCLISFHSKGFPLDKAIQYAKLHNPYVINNLPMQYDIQDRRKVYAILEKEGIEIPRYAVLDRDSPDPKHHELVESEDHVEVNGVIFNKPFVEKPVSAEDHNIYIYYPTSAGGGSQRLFRKIGSRSSVYSPESRVRKTGSFIYEDFMPTDGTDVKVYTVGPDYAHAEARKSPALDGKVERDSEGKEIRYPVILSNAEKLISRKVCLAFKQTVCGFDLLRANGKSFVCDVNGFSFVKNSNKYYDDTSKILGNMILRELANTLHIPWSIPFQLDDPPIVPTTFGKMMELRCVVAVIRHGDRTPKQKMKVEVRHPKFFEIFEKYDGYKHGHIKLKRPKQLQEILDIARYLLVEIQTKTADPEIEEKQGKLEQLKSVLEMYGHFSGINRKVQMKYQPKGRPRGSSSDDDSPSGPSLVLILKWGGELTPAGRIQAEELGRIFRCMYPGGGCKTDTGTQGLGLLRLHSTFRHDLKIYASDEGRVQMTAAAFAKGLLALEGELTPILVQMVKSANTNGLLDNDCDSSKYQNMAKSRLHDSMQNDRDFTQADRDAINPGNATSISQAMDFVKNPVKCCQHVHNLIQSLMAVVQIKKDDPKTRDAILYHGESWELMIRRWGKIEKDFYTKNKTFDISKIPDIYDCIKYDIQHNQHTLQFEAAEELYLYAKYLADIVIPQEYGLTVQEKMAIGTGICTPLLKKIRADLQRNIEEQEGSVNRLNPHYSHGVSSPGRHVRTRLYFTSESHVHSLLTVLRYGGLLDHLSDKQWRLAMEYVSMVSELNYMSQIVVMLYEDPTKDPTSEERFHVELHFSPGVNCCVQKNLPKGPGFRPHSRNDSVTSKNTSGDEESPSNRIEEENDDQLSNMKNDEYDENRNFSLKSKKRNHRVSDPIPIGQCHTVSGHEAMDLAKRLSEELAAQQQVTQSGSLKNNRAASPDSEPRSRSFEQRQHSKAKADHARYQSQSLQAVNEQDLSLSSSRLEGAQSSTNELPLTALSLPLSPEIKISGCGERFLQRRLSQSYDNLLEVAAFSKMSPSATNERPLSCTCLNDPKLLEYSFKFTSFSELPEVSEFPEKHSDWRNSSFFKKHYNPMISVSLDSFDKIYMLDDDLNYLMSNNFEDSNDHNKTGSFLYDINSNNNNINNGTSSTIIKTPQSQNFPTTPTPSSSGNNTGQLPVSLEYLIPSIQPTIEISKKNSRNPLIRKSKSIDNHDDVDDVVVDDTDTIRQSFVTAAQKYYLNNNNKSAHCPIIKITKKSHLNKHPDSTSTSNSNIRRHRHSLGGNQMAYFKMLSGTANGKNKMTTSTSSLFSTAVISGSSSAPNLRDMIPNTASPSVLEGFGGVPPIRPLETLHNALSLKQLDIFLEKMTSPSSPPKYPSTPLQTPPSYATNQPVPPLSSWSGHSSMASSIISAISSSGEPSSPNFSDTASISASNQDSMGGDFGLSEANITKMLYDQSLNMFHPHFHYDGQSSSYFNNNNENLLQIKSKAASNINTSEDITPASSEFEFCTNDATKGSTINEIGSDDEEATIAITPVFGSEQELTTKIDNMELNVAESQSHTSDMSDASPIIASTSKIDNKMHSKIQKQISLFEKDVSTQNKNLSQDVSKYLEMPFNIKQDQNIQSNCDKFYNQPSRFISAEDLEKYTPNIEKNLSSGASGEKCVKTKSCVNLKMSNFMSGTPETATASPVLNNHVPGALLVRESFIEPPKVNYIKKPTDYLNIEVNQLSDPVFSDNNLNLTNYQASTSASPSTSTSSSMRRKNNNLDTSEDRKKSTSRFTTTFVSEDDNNLDGDKNPKKSNSEK